MVFRRTFGYSLTTRPFWATIFTAPLSCRPFLRWWYTQASSPGKSIKINFVQIQSSGMCTLSKAVPRKSHILTEMFICSAQLDMHHTLTHNNRKHRNFTFSYTRSGSWHAKCALRCSASPCGGPPCSRALSLKFHLLDVDTTLRP